MSGDLDLLITSMGVLVTMGLLSCLCCLCMKISDLKLKCYVVEMAKKKGITVDVDELDGKHLSEAAKNETCTIMVPDVGIIL